MESFSDVRNSQQASSFERDEGIRGQEADCSFQPSLLDMRSLGNEYRWCQSLIFLLDLILSNYREAG